MRVYSLNVRFRRKENPPKHTMPSSQLTLRKFANMIPHIGVTQETIENIDPNDTMSPIDIIKAINETALDQLVESRNTSHEAWADSETTCAIVITSHTHHVFLALEIEVHVRATNIHVLTHPYAKCRVLDVAVHNIHLQIANVPHHLNKSRRTL